MEGNRNYDNQQFTQPNQPYSRLAKAPAVSLNVHLAVPTTTAAPQDGSHTPNTPEILNSIVNMQAQREEQNRARESEGTSAGPFGAEFARQCAIYSTQPPKVSTCNDTNPKTDVAAPSKSITPGYSYMEVKLIRYSNVITP